MTPMVRQDLPAKPLKVQRATREWFFFTLAVLLTAAVLLPLLGHRVLTDWDEGIYAEIAREMLAGGTARAWQVPHWNGHLWFEKPPLAMWLMACSMRLFGLNALGARLPSALAAIALAGTLHRWLGRRFGQGTAFLGTVILVGSFGFQHVARAGETDTLLSLFSLVAVLGVASVLEGEPQGWLWFGIGLGLALMTKGAAGVTLVITPLVLALLRPREVLRFPLAFAGGLLLCLLVALPWHLFMLAHFGQAFRSDYLGFHALHRATVAIEGHRTGPLFYLWVLLISAAPFSLLYPFAVAMPWRRSDPNRGLLALSVFAMVVICLFSLAKTRLPHYVAPAYGPLSALTAVLVTRWLARRGAMRTRRWQLAAGAAGLYGLAALMTASPRRALHSARQPDGQLTPDNREAARLLQRAAPQLRGVPGPLLLWRANPATPVTTAAFYSRHLVQQVALQPYPGVVRDPYVFDPVPLPEALAKGARLLLVDCSLLPGLPVSWSVRPVAAGSDLMLGVLEPASSTDTALRPSCPAGASAGAAAPQ